MWIQSKDRVFTLEGILGDVSWEFAHPVCVLKDCVPRGGVMGVTVRVRSTSVIDKSHAVPTKIRSVFTF